VDIGHPLDWSVSLAKVYLRDRSLSTSGLGRKALLGREIGHVLDPRSGRPIATDLGSVSVLAPTGAHAEALSTAFLVMGLDKALEYCEKHPDVGAVFVRAKRSLEHPEMVLTALSEQCVEVRS